MIFEISNLSIQTSDACLFIILGFAGIIIYTSRTFFDVLLKRVTCKFFGHDFKLERINVKDVLKCQRCQKESLDLSRYSHKR